MRMLTFDLFIHQKIIKKLADSNWQSHRKTSFWRLLPVILEQHNPPKQPNYSKCFPEKISKSCQWSFHFLIGLGQRLVTTRHWITSHSTANQPAPDVVLSQTNLRVTTLYPFGSKTRVSDVSRHQAVLGPGDFSESRHMTQRGSALQGLGYCRLSISKSV